MMSSHQRGILRQCRPWIFYIQTVLLWKRKLDPSMTWCRSYALLVRRYVRAIDVLISTNRDLISRITYQQESITLSLAALSRCLKGSSSAQKTSRPEHYFWWIHNSCYLMCRVISRILKPPLIAGTPRIWWATPSSSSITTDETVQWCLCNPNMIPREEEIYRGEKHIFGLDDKDKTRKVS